ncbi:hypothetical protein AUG19_01590 [archaeon 13_1_20CM_2_54_9]|nr:MAG: hypothetical protein AUG19_01590 [archaeon 13_1_20CM_2_54_9]
MRAKADSSAEVKKSLTVPLCLESSSSVVLRMRVSDTVIEGEVQFEIEDSKGNPVQSRWFPSLDLFQSQLHALRRLPGQATWMIALAAP